MIYTYPEKLEQFKSMATVLDVVQFLSIRVKELDQLVINPPYYTFEIPKKSGGVRTITAPEEALKKVQQTILKHVEELYHKPSSVYGFVAMDESEEYACPIVANAANHVNKRYVLTVDIHCQNIPFIYMIRSICNNWTSIFFRFIHCNKSIHRTWFVIKFLYMFQDCLLHLF